MTRGEARTDETDETGPETVRTLVAGVGNIFLGDDGFGVEVVRRLAADPARAGVRVADYGIRGLHLAYELMNGYDTLILVDAVRRGGAPGTVYVIEPEPGGTVSGPGPLDGHDMTPETVLRALESLAGAQGDDPGDGLSGGRGGGPGRVLVVGCEAADVGEGIGLSPPVARAVDEAVALVRGLLEELRHGTVGHGTRGGAGC